MNVKYFVAFMLCLSALGCDTLNTIPEDAITDLNYWNKVEDLKLFANSFYPILSSPSPSLDNRSDNVVTNTPDNWLFDNVTVPSSGGGWGRNDWSNIRNINYFLNRYSRVDGDEDEINHFVGEIRFFRAYEYFNKVKSFGDVPWYDVDLTTSDEELLMKQRDKREFVIEKIIEDLHFAINNLKNPSDVEAGRLHRFAALQFLSRVTLYEGTWMKYRQIPEWESLLEICVEATEKIITEGEYEIVRGDAEFMFEGFPLYYREQFIQQDLINNPECVMPKIFKTDLLTHNISRQVNESGTGVSKDFIESFLCVDGKPISLSPMYKGDELFVEEMENRDPRLRNMIDNPYLPYFLDGNIPISNPLTTIAVNDCPTGYMASKFRNPIPAQNEANQASFDWFVFRYAEVLLNNAEAKAELGSITQQDLDKTINKLRARLDEPGNFEMGRLSIDPPVDPLSIVNGIPRYGYEIDPLLYEIRRERRIELAFEGFRWDDIVRWKAGVLIENPKTMLGITVNDMVESHYTNHYEGTNPFNGRSFYEFTDWNGQNKKLLKVYDNINRKWSDKLYLNPLPNDQLQLNENLSQNPGW